MLSKNRIEKMKQTEILCIEDLVPKTHLIRDMDAAIDFRFIYELVRELYCADNGRPSIDPVVLFKIVLIQYTFGIRSMRQTIKEIEVNMAYRWFLGYGKSTWSLLRMSDIHRRDKRFTSSARKRLRGSSPMRKSSTA